MLSILRRRLSQTVFSIVKNPTTKPKTYTNITGFYRAPLVTSLNHDQTYRYKSKSKKGAQAEASGTETEEESTFEDEATDKHTKVMQFPVKSMRIDGILKTSFGIARNKIETLFYESKIRVNGQKLLKKSALAEEGDEIDIVKGASVTNPNFLTVARVEVLSVTEKGDNLAVKVRRCKSLTVENYGDSAKSSNQ